MKRPAPTLLLFLGIFVLTQACVSSHHKMAFDPGSVDSERYVRKVDQFVVIADGSLSMADRMHRQPKYEVSEGFLMSLNQTIPEMGYRGGLRTFGQGLCGSKAKTQNILDVGEYLSSSFGDGITRFDCANGNSPLDLALNATGGDLGNRSQPSAVIIVSDGLDMNMKEVESARALKSLFGDMLTIYAIQIGDNSNGRALLEKVVAMGGDGYVKSVHELTSAGAMADFVIDVFLYPDDDGDGVANHLDKCPGTPKGVKVDTKGCPIDSDGDGVHDHLDKCPGTPRGVPVDAQGCPLKGIEVVGDEWTVRGRVLFALNRADLKPEAKELLGKVADFLKKNPQWLVEIQGNTDSTGPLAWNMTLSEMRAESVKEHLVELGVAETRLTTKGFGPKEPIADNDTPENRARNRRVDFKPSTR